MSPRYLLPPARAAAPLFHSCQRSFCSTPIACSRNGTRTVRAPAGLEGCAAGEQTARWKPPGTATQRAQPRPGSGTGPAPPAAERFSGAGGTALLTASRNEVVLVQGDRGVLRHQASGRFPASHAVGSTVLPGTKRHRGVPVTPMGGSSVPPTSFSAADLYRVPFSPWSNKTRAAPSTQSGVQGGPIPSAFQAPLQ